MNVTHSISAVPNPANNQEGTEPPSATLGKRSRNPSTLGPIYYHTVAPSRAGSTSHPATDTQRTSEQPKITHSAPWSSNHRSELLQQVKEPYSPTSKKRASSRISPHLSTASGPPPSKRLDRRHQSRRELHSSPPAVRRSDDKPPLGTLFFSSSQPSQRPPLPYRLSSSEVGAKMLSKASKEDTGGVRTLKLARGSMNAGSPSRPAHSRTPSGSGRSYLGLSGKAKSPGIGGRSGGLHILNQVGVIELLEQDERTTFVLDLADQSNFEPGPLKLAFANASLRASGPILDMITGTAGQASPGLTATTAFSDFKAWCVSYVRDHESLDVALPSFFYARTTWTSCSLRKRFRVIKGNPGSAETNFNSNPPSVGLISTSSMGKENENFADSRTERVEAIEEEAQDYFGNANPSLLFRSNISSAGTQQIAIHGPRDQQNSILDRAPKTGMLIGQQDLSTRLGSRSDSSAGSPLGSRNNEAILSAASAGNLDDFDIFPQTEHGFFDWTRLPNSPALPRHVQFARSIDWASTPLGPIEEWSADLRAMCNLIMASPHPAAMYWGPHFVAIYNEAYILLAGQKHPQLMGQSYPKAWAEIWDSVKDVFTSATVSGQATMKDDDCLFIHRAFSDGLLEETYFSWSIIPLVGGDGSVVGLYNPAFEKTRRKIAERRMLTLREVGEKTATARDLKGFWKQCLKGLEINEYDSPFVLLYSIMDEMDSDSSSVHSNSHIGMKQCVLEGSLGVPEGHPAAAPYVDFRNGVDYLAQIFREAIKSDRPLYLSTEDGTLDAKLLEGIEWRAFNDPCRSAVCCPIHLTGGESTLGFLVIGINPRRPYDDDYSLYVQLLSRQLATAMASVLLFEEEIARGERAARLAAQDRIELSEQLAARTQEAVESETKFSRMAEFAPVGIFIADSLGRITYCNGKWYQISKVPKGLEGTDEWMDSVKDEDQNTLRNLWSDLVQNAVALNAEIRFKAPWIDQNGNKGDTWVLASAFPEKDMDGKVKVIFGSITDISQQKWAEHFEKRRMEEAVELKRQQENFIDITSHEMRNPLSAILQCADEISASLTDLQSNNFPQDMTKKLTKSAVDASGIIALCAQHQKRIVDDILTLSKLDSALLLVTPCDVQPKSVVQRALKMFDGEVHTADIKLNFKVDSSVVKLAIDWVKLDPSRLLQVLINLTTNAIKFTTTQEKRVIDVTFGASLERPSKDGRVVSYFPTRSKRKDLTNSADWGTGDKVYLHFSVEDTGRGLSADEMKLLFIRFSQASPRTHVQYGGSGLGLFISRELVELQGGEIGVASKAGEGSTFAFYVKARRSSAPKDDSEQFPGAGARKPSAGKKVMSPSVKAPSQSSQETQTSHASQVSLSQRPSPEDHLKVLIVEDNIVNQQVLNRQLTNIGYEVVVANHGGECLDRLKESTFWKGRLDGVKICVVLMDQEMPIMDGLTCTKEIRKLEEMGDVVSHVPIIAVTANARSEQIDTAIGVGMDDVVSKPFRLVDLVPKLEELIERYPYPAKSDIGS